MFDWFWAFLAWGEAEWWHRAVVTLTIIWALYGAYVVLKRFAGDDESSTAPPDN